MKLLKLFLLASVFLTSCGASAPPKIDNMYYYAQADVNNCLIQNYLPQCHPGKLVSLEERMLKWDYAARKNFTYTSDMDQFKKEEDWRSHADEVITGKKWGDDCDGLATTVLDLLMRDGFPPQLVYRAMVSTVNSASPDHFVGIVNTGSGWYVVGDTTVNGVYKLSDMRHRIIFINNIPEGLNWHKVSDSKLWISQHSQK